MKLIEDILPHVMAIREKLGEISDANTYAQIITFLAGFTKDVRFIDRYRDLLAHFGIYEDLVTIMGGIDLTEELTSIVSAFNGLNFEDFTNEFYSDFLAIYDNEQRKLSGVIYTPEPIVDFMVSGVDYLLTTELGINNGILDERVSFWDPSAGTMAYATGIAKLAREKLKVKHDLESYKILREMFIGDNTRVCNFELLKTPYVVGVLRLMLLQKQYGMRVDYNKDYPNCYCVNTLMDTPKNMSLLNLISGNDSRERTALNKRDHEDFTVIITNPPYNIVSENNDDWILGLISDYKKPEYLLREDGKPTCKPPNTAKGLNDDYVKFIRLAQYKIETSQSDIGGIVSYITNNYYIDGSSFRGLRKELVKTFDRIYVINLHGDWRKKPPLAAEGMKNENVFNVNCGIAIMFAVKLPKDKHNANKMLNPYNCEVYYAELFGTREQKLNALNGKCISEINFTRIGENLDHEFSPYISHDEEYYTFPYMYDIFNVCSDGITTTHDHEIIGFTVADTEEKIERLFRLYPQSLLRKSKPLTDGKWDPRNLLGVDKERLKKHIYPILWRGFDKRYVVYDPCICDRPKYGMMQYLLPHQRNVAIVCARISRGKGFNTASSRLITDCFTESSCLGGASDMTNFVFPLRYNNSETENTFGKPKPAKDFNINDSFVKMLPYACENIEEMAFFYIYGVLFSPTYRENYKELLSMDFPRIPFPSNYSSFQKMSELGKTLAGYHLFTDEKVTNVSDIKSNVSDFNVIKIRNHRYENGNIVINLFDYKDPLVIYDVPPNTWDFIIGGIPQLDQWLSLRKYTKDKNNIKKMHRGLTKSELEYLFKMINAFTLTNELLPSLDAVYRDIEHGVFPISFEREHHKKSISERSLFVF